MAREILIENKSAGFNIEYVMHKPCFWALPWPTEKVVLFSEPADGTIDPSKDTLQNCAKEKLRKEFQLSQKELDEIIFLHR